MKKSKCQHQMCSLDSINSWLTATGMSDLSNHRILKSDVRSQMLSRFFSAFAVPLLVLFLLKVESNVYRLDV